LQHADTTHHLIEVYYKSDDRATHSYKFPRLKAVHWARTGPQHWWGYKQRRRQWGP